MIDHPSAKQLTKLVRGNLEGDEAEAVVRHLGECAACLDLSEALWPGVGLLADDGQEPQMTAESHSKIEDGLFRRIHLAATGSELAWLVTGGFMSVILLLLRPLLASKRRTETERSTAA